MLYKSAADWLEAPNKRIMLFGMSGVGKTYVSNILRDDGSWFHYSVDYRIGTRYMGEHIVDNFKKEAMKNPFLAELLRSDSINICSNITFNNLSPLSTYLGKPGDPAKGGIPFPEYLCRQRLHRQAEINALLDTAYFCERATSIYGYGHFICDTSGSVVEVVDPHDRNDPVLSALQGWVLPVWIRGHDGHVEELVERFSKAPKPMYYQEEFLTGLWQEYLSERTLAAEAVDPDDFIRWGYRQLLTHRLPRYQAIAENWGVTIDADDVARINSEADFNQLIAAALA
ncbi:MAG: ATPase [Rhodobacteraceae bacterium]|nr:ATPase [Paracoccaceae bacterium]